MGRVSVHSSTDLVSVQLLQVFPPFEVRGPPLGVAAPGHLPPLDVLPPGNDLQHLGHPRWSVNGPHADEP
jgi:hypothetical protein